MEIFQSAKDPLPFFSSMFRSKQQTMDVLRNPPQRDCTLSGSADRQLSLYRWFLMNHSTISLWWRMTGWLRLWVWYLCSRAPPLCGLTSQVKCPCNGVCFVNHLRVLLCKEGCAQVWCMLCWYKLGTAQTQWSAWYVLPIPVTIVTASQIPVQVICW